jgi:leucyl aminopeptidase
MTAQVASVDCDALVVPVAAGVVAAALTRTAGGLPAELRAALATLADDARFVGKTDTTLVVPTLGAAAAKRVILTGVGPVETIGEDAIVRAFGAATRAARAAGARTIALQAPALVGKAASAGISSAVTGSLLGLYRFTQHRGAGRLETDENEVADIFVLPEGMGDGEAAVAVNRGRVIADAVRFARDLVNCPAADLTPERFAEEAVSVADRVGIEIEVLGPAELAELGAGAILAVGRGSANAPRLIRMRYRPKGGPGSPARIVGLVGKCITFDSGGYSIKTYEGMLEMKGDMAGGAAVLGVMSALPALGYPIAVDATICAAENMVSGSAFRPGDILRSLNGVTIEVLSTDAEGRLVLADGMVDAGRRGATELIDLATLTGAIVVALGEGATGLFASDDRLAGELLAAASATGERTWRMPLFDELEEKIRGDVGDVKNSGGRGGGAITAALFLRRFSEGLPWAHLDIAGSARFGKANSLGPKGASGVGVRTLLNYLEQTSRQEEAV